MPIFSVFHFSIHVILDVHLEFFSYLGLNGVELHWAFQSSISIRFPNVLWWTWMCNNVIVLMEYDGGIL